jgi:hypothetical protein
MRINPELRGASGQHIQGLQDSPQGIFGGGDSRLGPSIGSRIVRREVEDLIAEGAQRFEEAAVGLLAAVRPRSLDEDMRHQPEFTLEQLRARNSPRLVEQMLVGWKKAGWSPPHG